jgi:hypothetical protein
MANWYGAARSNYVLVKDVEKFKDAMEPYEVEVEPHYDSVGMKDGRVALFSTGDGGGWNWTRWDTVATDDGDEESFPEDTNEVDLIAPHLQPGEVMVMMEVGNEKLRYLTGNALAFNSAGETAIVSLDDIYEKAKEIAGLDVPVTSASY